MMAEQPRIQFVFNSEKTMQAAALFLQASGGEMEIERLFTLLYILDREMLIETGCTVTGDDFYWANELKN
jgi:hypothetical protein